MKNSNNPRNYKCWGHVQTEKTNITKWRSKQNKDVQPKQNKMANQRNKMKEKDDIMTMILNL
jgi:hypothetical protein